MAKLKFVVDDLLPQLSQVVGVVNSKNSLPILNDVLFVTRIGNGADERRLSLTTSDSETWLTVYVPSAEFDTEMMFCVAATDIYKALANLKGKTVAMTIDESAHTVTCEYGNGHFSLPFESANEFPMPLATLDDAKEKRIDAQKLLTAIEKTGFATANDELRPVMNGVHFDFFPDGMVSVASDGHKLAKYKDLTITHDGTENTVIDGYTLPKKPCHTLLSVLGNTVAGDVKVTFSDRMVVVNNTMFKMTTRLIEGRYPNYDAVIPNDNDKVAIVDKAAFVSAVKRVLPMGNSNSELVALTLDYGKITISAEDFDFSKSASEDVTCDYNDVAFEIGFKGSVLLQLLQNIDSESVKLAVKDPSRAGVITESTTNSVYEYTSIIMPMLLNK